MRQGQGAKKGQVRNETSGCRKEQQALPAKRQRQSEEPPMKRAWPITAAVVLLALCFVASARAEFGLADPDVTFTSESGAPSMQAGSHPFATTVSFDLNRIQTEKGVYPDERPKDVIAELPPGFIGNPTATPRCSSADFATIDASSSQAACPNSTAIGVISIDITPISPGGIPNEFTVPLYNLTPPPGKAVKLGFVTFSVPVVIEGGLSESAPFNVRSGATSISQAIDFFGSKLVLWGNPASPVHDPYRGHCVKSTFTTGGTGQPISLGECPVSIDEVPFITLPTSCQGPLPTAFAAASWVHPGPPFPYHGEVLTHDASTPPKPLGFNGCAKLGFSPTSVAQPTTKAASSPTGLDFSLNVNDQGITNPTGIANSDIKKAVVTLPEGFTTNPSIAEGLNVCTEADFARESAFSAPGDGVPNGSKIVTIEVETPVLDENVNGSLFIAKPYENPFGSLLAMYMVIKNPKLGIVVRHPLKIENDPATGRITTVAEDLPQLPFSHFKLHFREGARSPLASPAACGSYDVNAVLTPWSGSAPITTTSTFQIVSGPDGGPCPRGGLPPFKPGLIAGTMNNAAGSLSPFNLRLFRHDSEQEITHFSIKLPPGITGKLAGIPYCPDASIAAAKARTGPHGGQEEIEHPSCPAASEIGHTLAGSGVGPSLTYAPGKVYLAGPYNGSNLSMVAITAGKVGPFDLGTVVIREAFKIDPETAEVFIDSTGSDPIPHIIQGIPVHLRDIRAYVDRSNFVLNPSDCSRTSTASTLLGSGLDFGSEADDRPVTVSTPFQAADCAALPFKPKLALRLKGGTKRGAHPAFEATLRMNGIGEAGIQRAQVTLPKSEFIENAHFNTICTRVQFKAGAGNGAGCPAGSIYGKARAITPILGEPLTGPVFLRPSEHQLPDLVVALHNSQVDFDLVGHVDSVKGRLRNTFEAAPDAPVTSFVLEMQGGKKGLFVNSTNLCKGAHRAESNFTGQNGKRYDTKPELKVKCKGSARKGKAKAKKQKRRAD